MIVEWRKEVSHRKSTAGGELDQAVAIIVAARPGEGIKISVADREKQVVSFRAQSAAAHPDSTLAGMRTKLRHSAVGCGIENIAGDQREGVRVESEDPAMVRVGDGVTGVGDVKDATCQSQSAALQLLLRIEGKDTANASGSDSGESGLNLCRTGCPLRAVDNIQSVDSVKIIDIFVRESVQIHGAGRQIDHRRSRDADLRSDLGEPTKAVSEIRIGSRRGGSKVHVPQHSAIRSGIGISVEGINAVMLRRHEDDIARSVAGNVQAGDVKRLRIDMAVHRVIE